MFKQRLIWMFLLACTMAACGLLPTDVEEGEAGETAVSAPTNERDTNDAMMSSSPSMSGNNRPGNNMMGGEDTPITSVTLDDVADLPEEEQAIQLVAGYSPVAQHLANYPDWQAEAYKEEEEGETLWAVEFFKESVEDEEWLGFGLVDLETGTIVEHFVPRELTAEEYQIGQQKVEAYVLNDAEVLARLGDLQSWEYETYYERYDQAWSVNFWRGLDELAVIVYWEEEGDALYLEEIIDPGALSAEEERMWQKNQAIELAYEAPGIEDALEGNDDWHTYVEDQGNNQWSVEFVSDGQELFYALVDIESRQIINSK